MAELLAVLRDWLLFFLADNRYRLVHSEVGSAFGNALIELSSTDLRWRLVRDRSQIFLDCRPAKGRHEVWDWYSADLLIRLLTGKRVESAVLTREMAQWFEDNLSEIEGRFEAQRTKRTEEQLKELARLRAKELFG